MSIAIKIENLSKAYHIGQFNSNSFVKDLKNWYKFNYNDKSTNLNNELLKKSINWTLNDINLDIEQGQAIGLIGRNGAGKSTLLKILSRVTSPTKGTIKIKGRIASLLEVGTGFHPELTGRENIFLNGTILGMRSHEISKNFDEIVDFSGVENYIDTPVKRYSSGMYVRLAFAVAAHLQSEILIIDEVLAVGDTEFQKKCLGKMGDISKTDGRTILFVSHNLAMIKKLCNYSILLNKGTIEKFDNTNSVINSYNSMIESEIISNIKLPLISSNNSIDISDFKWHNKNLEDSSVYDSGDELFWTLKINLYKRPKELTVIIDFDNLSDGDRILTFTSKPSINPNSFIIGNGLTLTSSYQINLKPGKYNCGLRIMFNNDCVINEPNFNFITINETADYQYQNGKILTKTEWLLS